MDTTNSSFSELKAHAPTTRGTDRKPAASSIHYTGAKEKRIPIPYVIAGLAVLAGLAFALRGIVHF